MICDNKKVMSWYLKTAQTNRMECNFMMVSTLQENDMIYLLYQNKNVKKLMELKLTLLSLCNVNCIDLARLYIVYET